MKNLVLLALFFVATVCSAQIELEGNKEGSYRIKEDSQEWAPSGITAEPQAIEHINRFSQAINSPGTPILVAESKKILKLKPVFKKLVEIEEHFIVYKEESDNICFFMNAETKEESSYLILFSITLILLMIISNILFKKGHAAAVLIAFIAALIATFALIAGLNATFALTTAFALIALTIALIAVLIAALFAIFALGKKYKAFSITFYILMVIHIVLLFI